MIALVLAGVFALATSAYGQPNATETYSNTMTLQNNAFVLYWKYTTVEITFEIHAKTEGWVGLGVSENANMIGADIMVGWVKSGVASITDRHGGSSNSFPDKDTDQDVNLLFGSECDGWTVIKFSRQLGACEASADREITSSTTRLIWAYGTDDPTGDDILSSNVHSNTDRGSTSIYLLETTSRSTLPENKTYITVDFKASDFSVPNSETHYSCVLFKLAPVEKNHIVKVTPIITAGNERNVHHIIIYSCGRSVPDEGEIGIAATCYASNMAYYDSCSTLIAAWAIGGSEIVFSDVAGLPVGGTEDPIYFQLEIHYDNPSRISSIVDNSGLRLTYTPNLLPNDLGIWQLGSLVYGLLNFVPPGASEFLTVGVCGGTCISDAMNDASIDKVYAVGGILHSHLAGRKLKLRHIRNGVELEPLSDDSYDFNYQEIRMLNPTRIVQSGDHFRVECTYNTETRTQMTLHGLGTLNEMCLAFLMYYPKIDVARCESAPSEDSFGYFGIQGITQSGQVASIYDVTVAAPSSLSGKSIGQVMDEVSWNENKVAEFSQMLINLNQRQICTKQETEVPSVLSVPAITSEYVIESKSCTTPTTPYDQSKTADTCPGTPDPSGAMSQYPYFFVYVFPSALVMKIIWL